MSVLRAITKPLRDAYDNREELKEKAKDLPLYVLQTALSGVGQALLLGDRLRSAIKRLANTEEETYGSASPATEQLASEEPMDATPVRREPVIFAPRPDRPEKPEPNGTKPEPNGAKPEPVIFAPARKTPAAAEATSEPAPEIPADAAAVPAVTAEPPTAEPVAAEEPAAAAVTAEELVAEPVVVEEPAAAAVPAEPEATKSAKPRARKAAPKAEAAPAKPRGTRKATSDATTPDATTPDAATTDAATPDAAAAKPRATRKPATARGGKAPLATPAEQPLPEAPGEIAPSGTAAEKAPLEAAVDAVPAEPMPGYLNLTVASLRARMRGKSVEQLTELLAYEKATAGRDVVIRMYENRLAKLGAEA